MPLNNKQTNKSLIEWNTLIWTVHITFGHPFPNISMKKSCHFWAEKSLNTQVFTVLKFFSKHYFSILWKNILQKFSNTIKCMPCYVDYSKILLLYNVLALKTKQLPVNLLFVQILMSYIIYNYKYIFVCLYVQHWAFVMLFFSNSYGTLEIFKMSWKFLKFFGGLNGWL